MNIAELLLILLSWAASISGYPEGEPPTIELQDHAFFVENVCAGVECKVIGWYNDDNVVYLDRDIPLDLVDQMLVHELVHHLQFQSGKFDSDSCEDSLFREREAYQIQGTYMLANGRRARPMPMKVSCAKPPQSVVFF